MARILQSQVERFADSASFHARRLAVRRMLWVCATSLGAAAILCLNGIMWAQDSSAPSPSLGDLARQARAQRQATSGKPTKAQEVPDERQRAPSGFKSYDAGDYRLFVPFPYSLEGRENDGAVLLDSRLGVTNTEVMAGNPVPVPANLSDSDLLNQVDQLAGRQGNDPSCSPVQMGSHKAFRCSFSGSPHLLDREVRGTMEVVATSNSLIPVMCVSPNETQCGPDDSHAVHACADHDPTLNAAQKTNADIGTPIRGGKSTEQMCDDIIYPSIQLKEDDVRHPSTIADSTAAKNPTSTIPQDSSPQGTTLIPEEQPVSLGELARQTRKAGHDQAQPQVDPSEAAIMAPAGFQSFSVQFCLRPESCGEALVVIPEKTEVVSHVNGQYIFKTVLNGSAVLLYAGPADVNAPYRSMTDPDFIRIRDLANANASSHEKTDGVSTQEMTIEGLPALMTRFRYQRDQNIWWVGERTLIDKDSAQFLLACTAAEEHLADAEPLCTTLVNSFRFP